MHPARQPVARFPTSSPTAARPTSPPLPSLQVIVDQRNECVLVPIYGVQVPFHILTIKNASNNQDGDKAYIRINFNVGTGFEPSTRFPNAIFIKELSFRTMDLKHGAKVVQEIKSLRAAVMSREKERAERASLVQQDKLVRSKARVYSLSDLWIRPNIAVGMSLALHTVSSALVFPFDHTMCVRTIHTGKGRKLTGTLEAHTNGFRYSLPDGTHLDIMYRNIRHALFQPAENDLMTLIHFNLVNPIMVGKKKTADVQLYTEVMDVNETLDARRNHYDPDELEDEQRDRERRNKINRTFQTFVRRVQQEVWERDFADLALEFEIPFRELGFNGIPSKVRSMVTIYPTVNCLIELTEAPFTVVTMADVQLVSLERVGFNLRQFDMVLVFKDLQREVLTINAIESKSLDTIKEWLTSMDIKYYENKLNLQWRNIIKSILEDPEGFLESGGWSFLDHEKSDSEEAVCGVCIATLSHITLVAGGIGRRGRGVQCCGNRGRGRERGQQRRRKPGGERRRGRRERLLGRRQRDGLGRAGGGGQGVRGVLVVVLCSDCSFAGRIVRGSFQTTRIGGRSARAAAVVVGVRRPLPSASADVCVRPLGGATF